MREAAVRFATHIGYRSAGTVEFLFDQESNTFYFIEMNTRIQVEHPVTEEISRFDIVKEQIRIAAGEALSVTQSEVTIVGHAVECRVTAEVAEEGFRPVPGTITRWIPPTGPGVRVDTHCYQGYEVLPFYDSLIAKVITWGRDRYEAVRRMQVALQCFFIDGLPTSLPFLQYAVSHPDFLEGKTDTRWAEKVAEEGFRERRQLLQGGDGEWRKCGL